jgi:Na+-transporting methylmalonyl-CoA/oxaloacetate decarboxylase gamma subunit
MLLLFDLPELFDEGVIIAVTGYVIVFVALVLLYYFFYGLTKLLTWQIKNRLIKGGKLPPIKKDEDLHIPGEVAAAIAMAIYLCRDLHDDKSNVLTIKKISKTYSPWSSNLRNRSGSIF